MPARLAQEIEEAARRVASLECSLRVYRSDYPAAAAKVGRQLDDAWKVLLALERQQEEARR